MVFAQNDDDDDDKLFVLIYSFKFILNKTKEVLLENDGFQYWFAENRIFLHF